MSQVAHIDSKDVEGGGDGGTTTYYFDHTGAPITSENLTNGKPGQITSLVPDLLEQPLSTTHIPPQNRFPQKGTAKTLDDVVPKKEEFLCGIGPFKPEWMQKFASKKAFMLVFSLLAIIQSMCWAYFTATITTLEKRFKISSQTAGEKNK